MRKKGNFGNSKKNSFVVIFLAILFALMGIVLLLAVKKTAAKQKESFVEAASTEQNETTVEKWQEGVIRYKGQKYVYNNNLRTYLYMGIDKDGKVEPAKDFVNGGQSDAMFLLIVNQKTEQLSVLAINRNTMTDILVCDETGAEIGTYHMQICLQHGFGDGMRTSCNRSVDAVSNLLYRMPIHGYLAMHMGGIEIINDAVGGVSVEVLQDLNDEAKQVSLQTGDVVTLNGKEAYVYLRSRDTNEFDSATKRLKRQQQYIMALMDKMSDLSVLQMVNIYEQASDYMLSDIDLNRLAEEIKICQFDSSKMYTIPGETVMGEIYEEYIVDEEALYEMILELFYEPVE